MNTEKRIVTAQKKVISNGTLLTVKTLVEGKWNIIRYNEGWLDLRFTDGKWNWAEVKVIFFGRRNVTTLLSMNGSSYCHVETYHEGQWEVALRKAAEQLKHYQETEDENDAKRRYLAHFSKVDP